MTQLIQAAAQAALSIAWRSHLVPGRSVICSRQITAPEVATRHPLWPDTPHVICTPIRKGPHGILRVNGSGYTYDPTEMHSQNVGDSSMRPTVNNANSSSGFMVNSHCSA